MKRPRPWPLVPWLTPALLIAIAISPAAAPAQEGKDTKKEPPTAKADLSPAERYRDALKAIDKSMQEFMTAYRAAKTQEERQKLIESKYPDPNKSADLMLKIAEDAPKDPVAVEALVWVATNARGPAADKAAKVLAKDHVQDPRIASLCSRLAYDDSPQSEQLLREVIARNPGAEAKGMACLALGQRLKRASEAEADKGKADAKSKEAEALLDRVAGEFADVKGGRGTLGESAKNILNDLRNLGIGKTAPEIAGEDIDGKPLKLTDYRGKVVVLDFWGDW
ncbi:peroxiredoxin family protein [Aquisphaera giovannonii]|uniref:peroxiredoxin family protein n=1 Tax=Aquisphaera giovannonii TaxID=406548 RepID=UPI001AEF6898|nr:redoxin domain-containing protein [Aquisphaera giovannonii]